MVKLATGDDIFEMTGRFPAPLDRGGDSGPHERGRKPRSLQATLIEIYHYGERLVGCVECNRWSWRGSDRLFMELPEQDLAALRQKSDGKSES